jgi:hypothetical protein
VSHWDDRAIDAALHEVHGSSPPDLSARVLAALAEPPVGPLPRLQPQPRPPAPSRWWLAAVLVGSAALGAAASAAVAVLWPVAPAGSSAAALAVALRVQRGEVVCSENGGERTVHADDPAPAPFAAARGNRLRTPAASVFTLDPFGRLETGPHTELEVRSMEFTSTHGKLAAATLTLGVITGAASWHALTRHESAQAGELLSMRSDGGEQARTLAAENARLREQLAALQQQHETLRSGALHRDVAPAPAAPDETEVVEPPPPPPAEPALAFTDPKFADALAKIDWAKMGAVTHEMGPLLAKLAEAMGKEGAATPVDLAVKVTELNTALVAQVPAILETGLPGFGPNGTFTHPLVAANMLASSLAAAGQQLTPAQQQQIEGLVRACSVEAQSIADSRADFALEQLYAETTMKDRFFEQVGTMLSPQQQGAVFPDGARAYEGACLFDTGVVMRAHAEPVLARDAGDYARIVSGKLGEKLGLDEATTAQVRSVLAQAANDPELWRERATPKERAAGHFLRSGRTRTALRAQIEWMRHIQQQVPLTPEQRKELAKLGTVMVPLPR